jgi:hypothetical protein
MKRRAKEMTTPDQQPTLDECRAAGTHMIRCTADGSCKVCFEEGAPDPVLWRQAMDRIGSEPK